MKEKTIFPREERSDMLFQKILNDSWACEKLQETFCQHLFCNDDHETPLSPKEFTQALFNSYSNRDLSAFLMAICQNTLFDLLRNFRNFCLRSGWIYGKIYLVYFKQISYRKRGLP